MKYKIIRTKRGDQGSIVIVDDLTGLPVLTATEWLIRFEGNRALNTIVNRAQDLCVLLYWADLRSIDLNERLLSGRTFNTAELTDLAKFLGMSFMNHKHGLPTITQVGSLTQRRRVETSVKYIRWILQSALIRLGVDDPRFDRMFKKLEIIEDQLFELVSTNTPADGTTKKGLDERERTRLFQIIHPNYDENPFPGELQLRNYVMIGLLFYLGMRLGELLGLKIEDIDFGHITTIRVVKRKTDVEETRQRSAKQKRGSRSLSLSNGPLATALATYVNLRPADQTSPFLIITASGEALTLRAAQNIFEKLRDEFPKDFPPSFCPKFGRHTLSAGLERIMVEAGVHARNRVKYLMAIRGDSSEKSQDPDIQITIENDANRHLMNYQTNMLTGGVDQDVPF